MQFNWRISKYNPIFRDSEGRYLREEWTSISDIGRDYKGFGKFTFEEYITIEDLYINAIVLFMDALEVKTIQVSNLEKCTDSAKIIEPYELRRIEMKSLFDSVKNGDYLPVDTLNLLGRLLLREYLWCKLSNKDVIFVHFGYDFYMYIGCSKMCSDIVEKVIKSGLYVEPYKSPYLDD